jgi:hypothetical protein
LDIPNAVISAGTSARIVFTDASGSQLGKLDIDLWAVNPQDANAFGMLRLDGTITSRAAPGAQMDLVNAPNSTALLAAADAVFDASLSGHTNAGTAGQALFAANAQANLPVLSDAVAGASSASAFDRL